MTLKCSAKEWRFLLKLFFFFKKSQNSTTNLLAVMIIQTVILVSLFLLDCKKEPLYIKSSNKKPYILLKMKNLWHLYQHAVQLQEQYECKSFIMVSKIIQTACRHSLKIQDLIKVLLKLNYETMLFIEARKNTRLQSPSLLNLVALH